MRDIGLQILLSVVFDVCLKRDIPKIYSMVKMQSSVTFVVVQVHFKYSPVYNWILHIGFVWIKTLCCST